VNFEEAMQPILDCMCIALAEQGWEGSCCLHPGAPAFDSCCPDSGGGGEAWARLVSAYPSTTFPQENIREAAACTGAQLWALVIDIGAVRCVCDDLCDCGKRAANASAVLADAETALQAISCCFTSGPCADIEYRITQLTMIGPDGGCGGFRIELVRQYVFNCCPTTP
jgi:hypothetical protein